MKKMRWRRAAIGVLAALLIGKFITTGAAAWSMWQAVEQVRDETGVLTPAVEQLAESAGRLSAELAPLMPVMRLFGADGCALAESVEVGQRTAAMLRQLAPVADAGVQSVRLAEESTLPVSAWLAAWEGLSTEVEALREQRDAAQAAYRACGATHPRLRALEHLSSGVLLGLDWLLNVPWSVALADGAHWVIVLNNSDELRATGGFITAVVLVQVENGLLRFDLVNSFAVDNLASELARPAPPLPFNRYMEPMQWFFRDSNWSPDHREAAQAGLRIYGLEQGVMNPSGLVTVNLSALQTLADYLPALEVRGAVFNSETALDRVREAWGEDLDPSQIFAAERKNFLREFAVSLIEAIQTQMGLQDQMRLFAAAEAMLARGDVMVYATDAGLAAFLAERGWDGAMRATDGDYLMVVDSNMGYNKVDARIEREVLYEVDLNTLEARVTLTYGNPNFIAPGCTRYNHALSAPPTYFERMEGCYWNYARVFTMPGTEILGFEVIETPAEWFEYVRTANRARIDAVTAGGYPGFGTFLVTPVEERRQISFTYRLPESVLIREQNQRVYRLLIQRQAGVLSPALVIARVTLPEGAQIVRVSPAEAAALGGVVDFQQVSAADVEIEIVFR